MTDCVVGDEVGCWVKKKVEEKLQIGCKKKYWLRYFYIEIVVFVQACLYGRLMLAQRERERE